MKRPAAVILLLLMPACATSFVTTRTSTGPVTPSAPHCSFAVLTSRAARPYEELAILDVKPDGMGFSIRNAGDFKKLVEAEVCSLGGDAVFAEINGYGGYVRGTVLRWKD
jgi:hypothetical protein